LIKKFLFLDVKFIVVLSHFFPAFVQFEKVVHPKNRQGARTNKASPHFAWIERVHRILEKRDQKVKFVFRPDCE